MKVRLHVAMANAGLASRRKAEELIAAGNVQVNGKTIKEQGTQVDPETDTVVVNGKKLETNSPHVYYLMHKQRGVVSTASDPDGKKTVIDIFKQYWKKFHTEEGIPRLYPVGRLDEDSEGLIMLTNDGELANRLTHPKYEVAKTYRVMIKGSPSNTQLKQLEQGIKLKENFAQTDYLEIEKHEEGNTWLKITIHQGMHHQVRRMFASVGLEVSRLIRIQMGSYSLGKLIPGQVAQIEI